MRSGAVYTPYTATLAPTTIRRKGAVRLRGEIENRSPFAVTITEAGVVFEKAAAPKVTFSQTVVEKNGDTETRSLPLRLDSHDSMILTSDGDTTDSVFQECKVRYVYVRTGDGTVTKCSSPNYDATVLA